MIINKENYEMLLFDYVEGNLTEAEESALLKQVEKDDFLKGELELMKNTILVPETPVFPNKKALYKPAGPRIIGFIPIIKISSAAAAAVLLFFGLKTFFSNDTVPATNGVVRNQDPVGVEAPKNEETQVSVNTNEVLVSDEGTSSMTPKRQVVVPKMVENQNPSIAATKEQQRLHEATDEEEGNNKESLTPYPIVIILESKDAPSLNEAIGLAKMAVEPPKVSDQPIPTIQDEEKPSNLRQLLNSGVAAVLGPYREPKLEFQRAKDINNPGINIVFSTAEYKSTALIEFKK